MNVNEKIKLLREQAGLTQKELALRSGISEISIRKYESGDRNPKIEQLHKIATALNVKPGIFNDLLTLTSVKLFAGEDTNLSLIEPQKQNQLLSKINTNLAYSHIEKILSAYNYKLNCTEVSGHLCIEGNGIKIDVTDNDIKALETSIGFALRIKLEELLQKSTQEGE